MRFVGPSAGGIGYSSDIRHVLAFPLRPEALNRAILMDRFERLEMPQSHSTLWETFKILRAAARFNEGFP
jgi:hypothetical protein